MSATVRTASSALSFSSISLIISVLFSVIAQSPLIPNRTVVRSNFSLSYYTNDVNKKLSEFVLIKL